MTVTEDTIANTGESTIEALPGYDPSAPLLR